MKQHFHFSRWTKAAFIFALTAFVAGFNTACSEYSTAGADGAQSLNPDQGSGDSSSGGGQKKTLTNYHEVYNSVQGVDVLVKEVVARTDDGRTIKVSEEHQPLDFMLLGTTAGISIRLPGELGSGQDTVVELILKVKDNGHNMVRFSDGRTCQLKTGKEITLFARNPLILDRGVPYLVHTNFDPFQALFISCKNSMKVHSADFATFTGDEVNANCNDDNGECRLQCRLACLRLEITGIEFDENAGGGDDID